jgi:hypothetical protein
MTELIPQVAKLAADYLTGEKGKRVIEEAVGKAVESAVRDATGYGSEFSKKLKAAVCEKLKVPDGFDLPAYHDHVTKVVLAVVKDGMDKAVAAQVEARLKAIIRPVPAEIKLSEIAAEYRKQRVAERDAGGGGDDSFTCRLTTADGGFHYLELDAERGKKEYQCDVRIGVYGGKMFSLQFGGRRIERELFVGPLYAFERFVFQLHAAGTRVEVDADAVRDTDTSLVGD